MPNSFEKPLVVLLHAWPLQGVNEVREEGDEIPELERDCERNEAIVALQEMKIDVSLKCLPLNRETIVEAIETARVVLIGTHGLPSSGLVFEKGVGEAEVLNLDELREVLACRRQVSTRMIFVSACYSEKFGTFFTDIGIEHAVAIAGEDRVSNLASRAFFKKFLLSALMNKTIPDAVEDGIRFVETHPDLPPERRAHQRKKFARFSRDDGKLFIFDPKESPDMGIAKDLTESSDMFGFRRSELPRPLVGRHLLVRTLGRCLIEKKGVMLIQSERGLGSSILVHFLCKYLGDRNLFRSIYLKETFAAARMLLTSSDDVDMEENLLVIDVGWGVKEDEHETWLFDKMASMKSHVLIVYKRQQPRRALDPHFTIFNLDHLDQRSAERLQSQALAMLNLPNQLMLPASGNPRKIIAWAKSVSLQHPGHLEKLKRAKAGADSWEAALNSILKDCVVGPDFWTRREHRMLSQAEITWIKSFSESFPTLEQFWREWFKPSLEMLSAIETYWTNRSVLGFVSEDQTKRFILGGKDAGTFLFRVSERRPGMLTLSYVAKDGSISKTAVYVKPDGAIVMEGESEKHPCATLYEAVRLLRFLKKVVVSWGDTREELVDKNEAFSDLFS